MARLIVLLLSLSAAITSSQAFRISEPTSPRRSVPCYPLRCCHRVLRDGVLRRSHSEFHRFRSSSYLVVAYRHSRSSSQLSPSAKWMTPKEVTDVGGDDKSRGSTGSNNNKKKKKPSHKDRYFDPQTTIALIGGQSVLILVAIVLAVALQTPNFGLGPRFSLDSASLQAGCLLAVPLGALAAFLDTIEDQYPALQDVTKATQRSVLGLLGGTFKPIVGLLVATVLGIAAGVGEEMLFRGLLQYELIAKSSLGVFGSLGLSSVIFGLLHAVTPLYALMAALASVYFGMLYVVFDNLAVPIACHSFYDIGALLYAHWTVARLSDQERDDLALWTGPGSPRPPPEKR